MSQELRFIDPIFTCEVVLRNRMKAVYESAKPQFERLKYISNLGLNAYFEDTAIHNRHHHCVGLFRIFDKLCHQPEGQGLPKEFLWSFWCRLCFGQTGHASFAYDSEKAVILACQVDTSFRTKFKKFLSPVIQKINPCLKCTRRDCGTLDAKQVTSWFEQMINRFEWRRVHLWTAALKLTQSPHILQILQQANSSVNDIGFSEPEAFNMLICPNCKWDPTVRKLNSLDFVIRDMAYMGRFNVQMDIDSLIANANKDHSDWKLLRSIERYMIETLYADPRTQMMSSLFQHMLADLLIRNKVTLEELFGINHENALTDIKLEEQLRKSRAGKDIFIAYDRNGWKTWTVRTYLSENLTPYDVEREITGHTKTYLSAPLRERVLVYKCIQPHSIGLALCHRSLADRPEAKVFIKLIRSVLKKQHPFIDADNLVQSLVEGFVGTAFKHKLDGVIKRCASLNQSNKLLRRVASVVRKKAVADTEPGHLFLNIGDLKYPIPSSASGFRLNLVHAALSATDEMREKLGITFQDASSELWQELLLWQSIYFGLRPAKIVINLLETTQQALAREVIQGTSTAETDLECYTLLEALKHPKKGISLRFALPNFEILKDDGSKENEYDVVSFILKEDKHVEVWIWGVTTAQDLTRKRNDDMAKIQCFKDLLGKRWADDIRTVTCYIHKEGTDICVEIAGLQSRRGINK